MNLSKNVLNYLERINVQKTTNSHLLLTDLEKIIYSTNENYSNTLISKDLIELIEKWQKEPITEDLYFLSNNPIIKITTDDKDAFLGIMIFPIYIDYKIEGLAIFYRNNNIYSEDSKKAPNTIRKFIMHFMESKIFPIY